MQTDQEAARELMAASRGEAYDKQLALLLQRRKEAREAGAAANPATASPVKSDVKSTKAVEERALDGIPRAGFAFVKSAGAANCPQTAYAIVVVTYNFRHLPRLSDKMKEVAMALFESLVGDSFNRFSRRGSKLLINPSVVEFQDSMSELEHICAEEPGSSLFLFVSTHGARVAGGPNAGSYMLFSESRLSSEDELLLTAVHERELARMIHAISCKSKFIALELCQVREPTEKVHGEAQSIHLRIEEGLPRKLYDAVVRLQVARLVNADALDPQGYRADALPVADSSVKGEPALLNIVVMESCDVKAEIPVRSEDGVSNFLCRFNDAFRGGAVRVLERCDQVADHQRRALMASEVSTYVDEAVRADAARQNKAVRALYLKQVRTKYELAAEFEDISQSPQAVGTVRAIDFALGVVPDKPRLAPSTPTWVTSTLSSITLSWDYPAGSVVVNLPSILGFEVQIRGHGRASEDAGEIAWKTAAALQVLSYEEAARNRQAPPTQLTAHGLSSDTAYCFRVRAITAGGWGPFSNVSPAFRTHSATSATDAFSMVKTSLNEDGRVFGVVSTMLKHPQSGAVQRQCLEVLAKMAIKGSSHQASRRLSNTQQLIPPHDLPIMVAVRDAMIRFKKDYVLLRHGCTLFGRLAASNASWKGTLLSLRGPDLLSVLKQIRAVIPQGDQETICWCDYALRHLGSSDARAAHSLTEAEATRRIQSMYRSKKAREHVRALALTIYQRLVDPASGQSYYYNIRTGTASWTMPSFLSAAS